MDAVGVRRRGPRFTGRWDDPDGIWRTLYVGASRLVCCLEMLARSGLTLR